jgi:hypothetical protein
LTESKDFYFYPHNNPEITEQEARNCYLNRWNHYISDYQPNNHYANY